jgi:hypothetical protein
MFEVASSSALRVDLILGDRFSRSEVSRIARRRRYSGALPADQFPELQQDSLVNLLSSGLHNYRVALTVAQQYLRQPDPDSRHAVLGNARTITSLSVGAKTRPDLSGSVNRADWTGKALPSD